MRRTSLPAALPAHRSSIPHEVSGGLDTAVLLEAHGLVTDMLLDHAALPAHIVAGLRALANMLSPPVVAQSNPRPRPPAFSLPTDPEYTSDIDDIPYTAGENFSSLPKRNSVGMRKQMPPLHRRMSTSTWTTTTSATGMPTLEPQPNSRRRSTTFRPAIDGTPGSSPTQVVPQSTLERERDSEPSVDSNLKDKRSNFSSSSRWMGFSTGWASQNFSASSAAVSSSVSPHSPNYYLQGSHKARSFSANALYAATDNRRRGSTQELTTGTQRKTVCSLHPLTPSDLTHLSALAASTSILSVGKRRKNVLQTSTSLCTSVEGSVRSSPSPCTTPNLSPFPSPLPSRDPSPCNYQHNFHLQQQHQLGSQQSSGPSSRDAKSPSSFFGTKESNAASASKENPHLSKTSRYSTVAGQNNSSTKARVTSSSNTIKSVGCDYYGSSSLKGNSSSSSTAENESQQLEQPDSCSVVLSSAPVPESQSPCCVTSSSEDENGDNDGDGDEDYDEDDDIMEGGDEIDGNGGDPDGEEAENENENENEPLTPLGTLLKSYQTRDEDNCSTVSTLGDAHGDSCSFSAQLSPLITPPVNNGAMGVSRSPHQFGSADSQRPFSTSSAYHLHAIDSVIVAKDGICFDLCSIATDPILCRMNEWDYPIFDLQFSSSTQILSHMCYKVFLDVGLFETFKIPIKEFINYFHALEMGYRDKPYHNRMHAADVLHGVYYLTSQPIPGFEMIASDPETPDVSGQRNWFNVDESCYGIMGANFPSLELMALYTAAAMHDYDHPGRTNAFLVTTNAPQAILYNDRSVLENHHAAAAWSLLLSNDDCNFLKYLDKAEFKRFRYLVIEAILATDLKRHFEILSEFNTKVNEEDSVGIDWNLEADRLLVMEMCIKLADINGPCKFHDIHVQWTHRIAEEFYEQGDEETKLGLPISPYMDRNNPQLAKLQESFISHLVAPLCKACTEAGILPGFWEYEDDEGGEKDGTTADECSSSYQETDNENDDSSYSDDWNERRRSKAKIFCLQSKHLQDNHLHWMKVIREEGRRKEDVVKTESIAISTDDQMETIEEENNTPLSLNKSFSFEKEDSKL